MGFRRRPSLGAVLAGARAQAEAQIDRWSLWTPVALGCGAAVYFILPREPTAPLAWAMMAMAAALAGFRARWNGRRAVAIGLALLAFAIAGFAAAKLRTERVRAPVAPVGLGVTTMDAFVVDVASPGQGGPRLLLAPIRIAGLAPDETPIRVRITLKPEWEPPAPGTAIRVRGMINPPPPPASPGAYDFARDAFFDSVGGVGFALRPPAAIGTEFEPPWRLRQQMRINAARWSLARRIVEDLGEEQGGLAAAMVTGHDAFVPQAQVDALRAAGLAHIISISGLHMAIVGGFTFAAVRLLIAAWPWAALRVSGKKVAALAGLTAVLGYLLLSGAPNPAERSAITAAAAFGAMLFDRRAVTLHTLAISAIAILALQPEAVTEPGFQMSFAATTALVALAEAWPRPMREISVPWPIRLIQGAGAVFLASLAASFVAGLATGPFALQHFNRISTFGLATNLLVEPISSFLMMPALAVGAVLTPLGLGHWPLAVAGFAISLMNRIAEAAAGLPHAQMIVASAPGWTLAAAFLGILWLCLWRGPLRWLGLPLALAVSLTPRPTQPDLWVSADGSALAVREDRQAILYRTDVKLFAAQVWARRRGLAQPADPLAARNADYDCDRWSCAPRAEASGPRVAAIWTRRASTIDRKLPQFCRWAEVVIVRGGADPAACPNALVLTARDFERGGAAELYRRDDGRWRIVWAQPLRGDRPWTAGVIGDE
ncbi:MAG TPA: ComEC/Rec2 family competence protein [Phenylobacterium sp.]|nr:ComEC/Rec2 family competence protein [Phenylobacterium sp.]